MEFETVSVKMIDYCISNPIYQIVDVRERCEYEKMHIRGAINIYYEDIDAQYNKLDINKIILLYCERGSNSLLAAKNLAKKGFCTKSVVGGINMYRGKNLVYK